MSDEFRTNLLGPAPTLLPEEPDVSTRLAAGERAGDVAASHPASSAPWAILADEAFAQGRTIESYAFARTGYHRGLDALRRNGWRGAGPIPWEHEPNQGFLRALYALGRAAGAIGETEEAERVRVFLNESDAAAQAAIEAKK
ncbi:DUF3151 domain-containing protein [Psychromicrobium xiongbiense]|uniref:DUF3151 domain-containing protein n=1 Tax=Psychromicrobium xiongbiense TaxID=3051184 RepID=UPI0025573AC8|nr:DUF3151 domain-containing protein [Psychromicrobium sp. YIM S02556]